MWEQIFSFLGKIFPSAGGIGNDLRKEIAEIAHDLFLYGNVLYGGNPEKAFEASEIFRKRAAALTRIINQIRCYWWARLTAGLPARSDVEKAIEALTGLSNQVVAADSIGPRTIFDSVETVKRLLRIR
jgi:hypothetical protein